MGNTVFCPQCGDASPVGQKFCEKCGAKLPTQAAAGQPTPAGQGQMPQGIVPGGLFDPRRDSYVVKEKFWDWGSGPIYDGQGNEIGKMHRKVLSIRQKIEFVELNGQISASINRKLLSIKPTYDIHDAQENLLARLSKTLFSVLHPKFELKDGSGQVIFTAIGKFMGFDFKIFRGKSKDDNDMVAEIHKADRWKDVFFGGGWDFKDTYGVKIHAPDVDRRLVIAFVITIDNVLHDK